LDPDTVNFFGAVGTFCKLYLHSWRHVSGLKTLIYNAIMAKRQIGVEVLVEDHFWNDAHGRYVYSFHCPACAQLRLIPELGIYRCECGSWLIVTNQR